MSSTRQRAQGFTLIEALIMIVVLSILAAIAIPTFQDSVRKGRRADAVAALTQVMQAQERFRASNASYYQGVVSGLAGAPGNNLSAGGHYDLTIADASATAQGYTAVATARSSSPQASDAGCTTMQVTINGGSPPAYLPAACWAR